MSVWRRYHAPEYPHLVTTNTVDRRKIFASPIAARLLLQVIAEVRLEEKITLRAFVIMPDHIHLVIDAPADRSLGHVMQLIKGRFARRYNQQVGFSGELWQGRYHERALRSERELVTAIAYVEGNPVAAALVEEAADYPWSSASGRCIPVPG